MREVPALSTRRKVLRETRVSTLSLALSAAYSEALAALTWTQAGRWPSAGVGATVAVVRSALASGAAASGRAAEEVSAATSAAAASGRAAAEVSAATDCDAVTVAPASTPAGASTDRPYAAAAESSKMNLKWGRRTRVADYTYATL